MEECDLCEVESLDGMRSREVVREEIPTAPHGRAQLLEERKWEGQATLETLDTSHSLGEKCKVVDSGVLCIAPERFS